MNVIKTDKKYASEFLTEIPVGIVDKVVCGCGMTTIAIENNTPTIIAVPNVQLITNKQSQYPNSRSSNTIYGLHGSKHRADLLDDYLKHAVVPKIMVTYDSLHKCEHLLTDGWRLIIDEADQLLFMNDLKIQGSSLGDDAVSKVYSIASQHTDKVSFISATHVPLKYLPDFMSDLPYTRIEWHDSIKAQPFLMKRGKPYSALSQELIAPMERSGFVELGGSIVTKVIIFVNSLSAIMTVISDNMLKKRDVGIICSDNVLSITKLEGYNVVSNYSKLPKYTFITSSGFQGIDLYDTEALPVVVSCTGKRYTMLGVEHQLKQAVSRIRNYDNAHVGRYAFIYNQSIFDSSEEELNAELDDIATECQSIAANLNNVTWGKHGNKRYTATMMGDYKKYLTKDADGNLVVNNASLNFDRFFVNEIRKTYTTGFDTASLFDGEVVDKLKPASISKLSKLTYQQAATSIVRLKIDPSNLEQAIPLHTKVVSWYGFVMSMDSYNKFVSQLATIGRILINPSEAAKIVAEKSIDKLTTAVHRAFKVGSRHTRAEAKQDLRKIYSEFGISKSSVYTELLNFLKYEEYQTNKSRMILITSHTK